MGIITFISSRNYIAVNRILMKEYGLHEAILLGELASEYDYWEAQGQITEDGFFYSTVENVKENLNHNIYKTIIPRNVRLAEAPSHGLPINLYDPKSTGAESYMLLAEEVIHKGEEE